MPRLIADTDRWAARSEPDRAAHYREQADRFQLLAKMEIRPRARARLLELAGDYQLLSDRLAGLGEEGR